MMRDSSRSRRPLLVMAVLALCAVPSCGSRPSTFVAETPEQVLARLGAGGHPVDASLDGGRVRYLGFEALPEGAQPGDQVRIVHYWVAAAPVAPGQRVFVHVLMQGATGWVPHGDHTPVPAPEQWPAGGVIRDEHALSLPPGLETDTLELRVGLFSSTGRMRVDRPEQHDGTHRVLAGRFAVAGTPRPLPSYRAPRLTQPPVLDGLAGAAEWGGAPWIGGFERSTGKGSPRERTRARLAWDATHLYVAMEAADPDIQGTLTGRDAPVYHEEALEVFLDPTGGGRDYVELQVSPRGAMFDAAFAGGARRNMSIGFDARYEVAVAVDGTIDDGADRDRSWSTEWSIDLTSIPGAVTPVLPGSRWRINLFRIGKDRVEGRQLADESAWVAPLMGDLHNLERFGELWFSD